MDLTKERIDRILVRATNWVGDALMTTPALTALRENFPKAEISVLAKPWVAPVYENHPGADQVLMYDKERRGFKGLIGLAGELKGRFDLAVLFQNAIEAALIAWLARIPRRLGYNTDGRGWLLNRRVKLVPEDKRVHETEYYLRLLARAGLAVPDPGPVRPVFYLSAEYEARAAARLAELGLEGSFLLGLAPGAAYGSAKQWPAERYAAAADIILGQTGGAALVFGSSGEAAVAGEVKSRMSGRAVDLSGQTGLAEAAALIKQCHLFLTNDSGLMHVAAAVGPPLVAVFGSTNPITTSPVGDRVAMVRHPVDCSPCLKPECTKDTHICMESIAPGEVAEAGLNLLGGRR